MCFCVHACVFDCSLVTSEIVVEKDFVRRSKAADQCLHGPGREIFMAFKVKNRTEPNKNMKGSQMVEMKLFLITAGAGNVKKISSWCIIPLYMSLKGISTGLHF